MATHQSPSVDSKRSAIVVVLWSPGQYVSDPFRWDAYSGTRGKPREKHSGKTGKPFTRHKRWLKWKNVVHWNFLESQLIGFLLKMLEPFCYRIAKDVCICKGISIRQIQNINNICIYGINENIYLDYLCCPELKHCTYTTENWGHQW